MHTRALKTRHEGDLEAIKKSLGSAVSDYTEAQLRQLQRDIDVLAELLLDLYPTKRRERRRSQPRPQAV